jgi:hypothetical protein
VDRPATGAFFAGQEPMMKKRRSHERHVQGEGDYASDRRYRRHLKEYLERADIEAEARAAEPRTATEARELLEAEQEGRERAKAEQDERNPARPRD